MNIKEFFNSTTKPCIYIHLKLFSKTSTKILTNEAIIQGDFAENYSFVVQDEAQGFHWNNTQCTLHPIVIYYKEADKLMVKNICFISDDLGHDVDMVYEVLRKTITYIKENISSNISLVHYFSDGCAGQYKNCKNFINICHHKSDFDIQCEWNFFATSHGKSACDGIGGTVKRLAARASLQRPLNNQILSTDQMFKFCVENITGIHFIFVSKQEVNATRKQLQNRYEHAKTVPGTRSFHHFQPKSKSCIVAKRFSHDDVIAIEFNFLNSTKTILDVSIGDFVVSRYDEELWVGMILEVNKEFGDAQIKFLHPHYPARSYKWPIREDLCWVPIVNILYILKPLLTVTGRQYHIDDADKDNLLQLSN